MAADGSDPAPSYPMPGPTDFSADQEKAMRQGGWSQESQADQATGKTIVGPKAPLIVHPISRDEF